MSSISTSGDLNDPFEPVDEVTMGDSDPTDAIDHLNSFLRGEISAAETYRMALDKFDSGDNQRANNAGLLREIQEEHARAAVALRERVRELGGQAADSSGAWGAWAKFTLGTAKIFGDTSTLKGLKEGEEHGLKDFRDGLDKIDQSSMQLVENQLIPAIQRHINLLDQLINSVGRA